MPKPAIKDGETYSVTLKRAISVGRSTVTPGPRVRLRGDVLKAAIAEDAASVEDYEIVR